MPELPELRIVYEDALERPIKMDEDTSTMLAKETWCTVEQDLTIASDADLKAAQRAARVASWEELVEQNQAPRPSVYVGDRQVEGAHTVLQLADSGRVR